ncbi:MAG: MFS transporter [Deltaproteobacteria bacterium]|nr:MFS transporter [Deltaproteobacteria bacterium]
MHSVDDNQARKIIAIQYALYFGSLGIFLPYFNLYCYHLGFNGVQIGILSSLRSVVLVLFALIWGAIADRFQIRRTLYILCNLASTLIWGLYFFSDVFWELLLITACYGVFYAPIIAFLEAFSMDLLGKEKRGYGRIRAWGSTSFIATVTVVGWVLGWLPIQVILVFIFIGGVLQTLVGMKIPPISTKSKALFSSGMKAFINQRTLVFLFCAFLMLASHGAYYGFFSIYLESLGFGSGFIGFAWALASIAEILVMINSKKIFQYLSFERALTISFIVASLRWVLLGSFYSWYAILMFQILHAGTYGMFHVASILYMDRLSPAGAKTLGQSMNNAMTYGLGLMTGFFFSGIIYENSGAVLSFQVSALTALCAGIVFAIFQYLDRRNALEK